MFKNKKAVPEQISKEAMEFICEVHSANQGEINKLFVFNLCKHTIHQILIFICRLVQAVSAKV